MALGNVIGSNIFNILLVGGLASAISPIGVNMNNIIDIVLLIIISLYIMILVWKKQLLTRAGGMSMLVIYAAYMVYICVYGLHLHHDASKPEIRMCILSQLIKSL